MTLKLTERDKKLLVVLAVVILVAGLGGRVILPLMNTMSEVQAQLNDAKIEKAEKEIKVAGLPGLQTAVTTLKEQLEQVSLLYKGELLSKDVDELLTDTAIAYGVTVVGLNISMPRAGDETLLAPYIGVKVEGESLEQDVQDAVSQTVYSGFATATVNLRLSGERQALQAILDDLFHRTPTMRVSTFQWGEGSGGQELSLTLEIYMMKDVEAYLQANLGAQEQTQQEGQ